MPFGGETSVLRGRNFYPDPNVGVATLQHSDLLSQNEAQRRLQRELAAQGEAGSNYRAQLAADAQRAAAEAGAGRFNQVFSALKNSLGGGWGGGVSYSGSGGSQIGSAPAITAGPIWSPQQIQQQVNTARARNDVGTGTELRGIAGQMANRGFAGGSPLQQALQGQARMAGLIANTQAGTQIPWEAAQANALQLLKGQTAQEQQFAARQQEQIERAKVNSNYRMGIASALAGLI